MIDTDELIESERKRAEDEAAGEKFSQHIAVRVAAYYKALLEYGIPQEMAFNLTYNFSETYTESLLHWTPK